MNRIIILFCLITGFGYAQTSETLRTGRPGNASGAYSVGKKVFQIENGLIGYSDFSNTSSLANSLYLRYGISERIEMNLTTDLSIASGGGQLGYGGPNVGLKFNWFDNHADWFSFGTVLSHNFGSLWDEGLNVTSINNIFSFNVTEKFGVSVNNQFEFYALSKDLGSFLILNLGYSLPESNSLYVEWTQYFIGSNVTNLRLGWYKQLNNDFQIDASLRFDQVDSNFPNRFDPGVSIGVSKRFLAKK